MIQENIARIGVELREMTERGERRDAERAELERDNTDSEDLEEEEEELIMEGEWEMREKEWQERERLAYVRLEKEREAENQRLEVIEEEARKEALEKMVRELEIDRLALERLKSQRYKEEKEREERRRRDRERLEMLRWEEERYRAETPFGPAHTAYLRSEAPSNPFLVGSTGGYFLDGLNLPFMDTMGGATSFYNVNGGIIDQNSGNTTTNITTDSNNDAAVRIGTGETIFRLLFLLPSMLICLWSRSRLKVSAQTVESPLPFISSTHTRFVKFLR